MGTLSEEVTFLFPFLSPISLGVYSIRKEQILSFKSRPYFERAALYRIANRKSQKLFPFVKMIEIHGSVLIHLKHNLSLVVLH